MFLELEALFRFRYMLKTYLKTKLFIRSGSSSTRSKLLLTDLICSQFDLAGRQLAANKTASDYFGAVADHVLCLRQQRAARIIGVNALVCAVRVFICLSLNERVQNCFDEAEMNLNLHMRSRRRWLCQGAFMVRCATL